MTDKKDYDARPNMFYQQQLLEEAENAFEAVGQEFYAFRGKRIDSVSPKVVEALDEVFLKIDRAAESLDEIRMAMAAVIDIFDGAKFCYICGDYHETGSVPISCRTGDGA